MSVIQKILWGSYLVLACPAVKSIEAFNQTNKGGMTQDRLFRNEDLCPPQKRNPYKPKG